MSASDSDDAVIEVSARELRADPARFHGRRVRFRDIVTNQFESMSAAGAWWAAEGGPPEGHHLAEIEGRWRAAALSDRGGLGHFGQWPAEITGPATLVSWDEPTTVEEDRLESAPELVPLLVECVIDVLLQGWSWRGRPMSGLGKYSLLPSAERAHRRAARLRCCRAYGELHVHAYELLGQELALAPRLVAAEDLPTVTTGAVIEVVAELTAGEPYTFERRSGEPTYVNWPRLGGAFDLVMPEVPVADRYVVANVEGTPGLAAWLRRLEAGPVRVRVVGEVWNEYLWASSITVE